MKIEKIMIDPDPNEPFPLPQGYRVGDFLLISVQPTINGNGEIVGADHFDAQAERAFADLERVLRTGGSSLANIVNATIFLRDMSNSPKVVELRGKYFNATCPVDAAVQITSSYSSDALIEIEAIALVDEAAERS